MTRKTKYHVGVVGATGAVGREMLSILDQRKFPIESVRAYASEKSVGQRLEFGKKKVAVELLTEKSFTGIDIALFSAGGSISQRFAPIAAESGAVVIDNSSAFRMEPDIPLVVPEVNPQAIEKFKNRRIIANPNCSTIQLVVALKPIHDLARIKRVVVSTYQSTAGAGQKAMNELSEQVTALFNQKEIKKKVFPHQIAFNCIPHIDVFLDNGYTKEEMKVILETQKIMGDSSIQVTVTAVRVPVFCAHSESVNIETEKKLSAEDVRQILRKAPGVVVKDNPVKNEYPLAIEATGRDEVFVGRIREDESIPNGINLWIVADNLRKGAALNAVQIAEILANKYL
ncbi:MAG: aspartate-semialdehyde dehydrogenase [Deltaproteobacteria bacterium]|nr:aspartate-semialdehyde dehydrogenase [Deltaproteobacteria bacterium]